MTIDDNNMPTNLDHTPNKLYLAFLASMTLLFTIKATISFMNSPGTTNFNSKQTFDVVLAIICPLLIAIKEYIDLPSLKKTQKTNHITKQQVNFYKNNDNSILPLSKSTTPQPAAYGTTAHSTHSPFNEFSC